MKQRLINLSGVLMLVCIIIWLTGCSSIRPASEVKTVLRAGCDLSSYHHNAERQEIDIQCK